MYYAQWCRPVGVEGEKQKEAHSTALFRKVICKTLFHELRLPMEMHINNDPGSKDKSKGELKH